MTSGVSHDIVSQPVEWHEICPGENGKQLLRRRKTIFPLGNLGVPIFARGIKARDIVELFGGDGCGKTELALHAVVTCVIPRQYGGIGGEVLWLDVDYKFSARRLAQLVEVRLATRAAAAGKSPPDRHLVDEYSIYVCEIAAAFLQLQTVHETQSNSVYDDIAKILTRVVTEFPVSVIATKSALRGIIHTQQRGTTKISNNEFMPQSWCHLVTQRIAVFTQDGDGASPESPARRTCQRISGGEHVDGCGFWITDDGVRFVAPPQRNTASVYAQSSASHKY